MAKVFEQTIPHLMGGISQQPAYLRHPTTSQEEVNTWPTFSQGLRKRPPTLHQAKLMQEVPSEASVHLISFMGKLFLVMIDDGKLLIWDEKGAPCKVTLMPGSEDYLKRLNPEGMNPGGNRFHCLPHHDMTYIVNKSKKVEMAKDQEPSRDGSPRDESPFSALVFCKHFVHDAEYKIEILAEGEEELKVTASSTTKSKKELEEEIEQLKARPIPERIVYRDRPEYRGGR